MDRFSKLLLVGCVLLLLAPTEKTIGAEITAACSELAMSFQSSEKSEPRESNLPQEYVGKQVKWTATLQGINETLWGLEITVKCSKGSRVTDATVSFDNSWGIRLRQLKEGQQVQFTGQLDSYSKNGGFFVKEGALVVAGAALDTQTVQPGVRPEIPHPPQAESRRSESSLAPEQAIHSPSLSVGDEFVIEHRNYTNPKLSYTGERKVVSLDGTRMKVLARNLNSSYVRTLDYDLTWNLIAVRTQGGDGFDYSPAIKYFDFPLYPGKRWTATSMERNIKTGQVREHTIIAEVGGWENVTVQAGTFRAIKVMIRSEVKNLQTGRKTSGTDISWYAPGIKRSVKSELTSFNESDANEVQVAQLIRYSVK